MGQDLPIYTDPMYRNAFTYGQQGPYNGTMALVPYTGQQAGANLPAVIGGATNQGNQAIQNAAGELATGLSGQGSKVTPALPEINEVIARENAKRTGKNVKYLMKDGSTWSMSPDGRKYKVSNMDVTKIQTTTKRFGQADDVAEAVGKTTRRKAQLPKTFSKQTENLLNLRNTDKVDNVVAEVVTEQTEAQKLRELVEENKNRLKETGGQYRGRKSGVIKADEIAQDKIQINKLQQELEQEIAKKNRYKKIAEQQGRADNGFKRMEREAAEAIKKNADKVDDLIPIPGPTPGPNNVVDDVVDVIDDVVPPTPIPGPKPGPNNVIDDVVDVIDDVKPDKIDKLKKAGKWALIAGAAGLAIWGIVKLCKKNKEKAEENTPVTPPVTPEPDPVTPGPDPVTPVVPTPTNKDYEVKQGDNVWNIAKAQLKEELGRTPTNKEIRERTEDIIEANGLEWEDDNYTVIIKPGDKLNVAA